jgi:nitroreductase
MSFLFARGATMSEHDARLALLYGRRSVRTYTNEDVSNEDVVRALECAMAAPSACCRDPWRFVVVRDATTRSKIADALPNGKMLTQAPVGIVVCGDLSAAHDGELSYMLQDCSAAVENLLLAIHALGLGACWLGVHPRQQRVDALRALLAIPEPVLPIACVALGHPAETKRPRTRFDAAHVHRERW